MITYTFLPFDFSDHAEIEFICRTHLEVPAIWIDGYSFTEAEIVEQQNYLKKAAEDKKLFGLTAKVGHQIIGFIWAERVTTQPDCVYITSLWTAPGYRKRGVATALKQELESLVKARGISKIRTSVFAPNAAMLELNLKLGYRIVKYNLEKEL